MTNHLRQQFGNYRLLRAVGNGGFATVYLGEHIHLGTQAAIKVLKTDLPDEESEAFRTEARTIARLIHPHIVRVLDFGLKGRTPFLVMDYAPYGSLRGQFPAGRPLSLAKTLPYVKQVADALHYAHQRRVIHRDIKPENMLLDVQERVLLSDFGLAVVLTSSRQHTTFDMAGTIAYMAPEQIRGKPCPASDQYALGVVLYQWLTGILPFQGSPQEILLQHQASHPPSLRARGAEITPVVEAVIFQALAKEPRHRFDSVKTFVTALLQAAQGRGQNTLPYELRVSFSRPAGFVPWCRTPQHPLVGRERELQVLRQLLQDPRKQDDSSPEQSLRRSCVLLAGDPGIGKTRLAEETSLLAQRQGWVVLWGRAHFSEQHMPYRVWIDVLRGALAYGSWPWPEVSASPERYRPLAALLPELAELFLTLPSPSGENLEQTQFRIWEAVLALFATICDHSPLLIVLDDLHWADHVSCQLLGYLVRNLASTRVFLIGSVREQEISATHPLRTLYNLFQQHRLVITLVLSALTASQVARLVAHLPPPVAEAIQKQAAGNPFFVEELARFPRPASTLTETALPSGPVLQRGALPPGIISIFEQRVAQLSQRTQKMLSYAAVLGDAFSFDVLRLMQTSENSSEDEDALLDQLDEALQARLLLEEHAGMQILYHFWHPLLVDYLYTRLSAARRARLHGRAAYALREMMKNREGEAAATIVYHLVRGGSESSLLVRYAQLAGEHAHALAAYPEAEKHYRLALAQLGEVAPATPPEDYLIFAHLFECLGECSMVQGKFEEARTCYERAFALRDALPVSMREEERQDEAQRKALFSCEIGKTWHYLGKSHEAQQAYRRGEQIL